MTVQHNLTEQQILEICNLYKNNTSRFDLSNKYNCDFMTIDRILRKNNIEIRNDSKLKLTEQDELKIVELYNNKNSPNDIAKIYNCAHHTIMRIVKRHNIPIRNKSQALGTVYIPDTEKDKIEQLFQEKSVAEIAEIYKCPLTQMSSFIRRHNLKGRPSFKILYSLLEPELLKNKEQIIEHYKKHKSLNILAEMYKCSADILKRFMEENDIERRINTSVDDIPLADKEKLHDLHHNKMMTMKSLGKLYNTSQFTMAAFFDKNNIPRRTQAEQSIINGTNMENFFKKKPYTLPSGKQRRFLGYEPNFLDYVFENNIFKEDDFDFKQLRLPYIKPDNTPHLYIPDFYIPKLNLIIECKSSYILERVGIDIQLLKENAVKSKGYNYLLILDNDFSQLDTYLKTLTQSDLENLEVQ